MRVALEPPAPAGQPSLSVQSEHALGMALRPGLLEVGVRRSAMRRVMFDSGVMALCIPQFEHWIGLWDTTFLTMSISDEALVAATDERAATVELQPHWELRDSRLRALATAVDVERTAGFPSGRLFLDSIELALASTLVKGHARLQTALCSNRGGLGPARLRRLKEFIHAEIENELTLKGMAQCVGLSTAYFSEAFRKSTGETPHEFVLRCRVERAKEMLRERESRVLDVAVACGFKTQQHFARIFRQLYGTSPTEFRNEFIA